MLMLNGEPETHWRTRSFGATCAAPITHLAANQLLSLTQLHNLTLHTDWRVWHVFA